MRLFILFAFVANCSDKEQAKLISGDNPFSGLAFYPGSPAHSADLNSTAFWNGSTNLSEHIISPHSHRHSPTVAPQSSSYRLSHSHSQKTNNQSKDVLAADVSDNTTVRFQDNEPCGIQMICIYFVQILSAGIGFTFCVFLVVAVAAAVFISFTDE